MSLYAKALEAAITVARTVGAALLAEFHRPEGPRGDRDKAPADAEAEAAIHGHIMRLFPDWGFLGEELPGLRRAPGDAERHCWVVDPNDGTSAFHHGYRGSAVSIGLLRGARPVLGVVFAYTSPDDRGDLFTWAEGTGPLHRNGKPVERAPWPARLAAEHTVSLSYYADDRPEVNVNLVHPARFRSMPSIAYRMALAAAGDADAAVCVGPVRGLDFAGGHALILASDGAFFGDQGEPITYTDDGISAAIVCAAGHPDVALDLATRPWKKEIAKHPRLARDLYWVRPTRGQKVESTTLLERAQGALLGQLTGDSLGSLVEFRDAGSIRKLYPHGLRDLADGGPFNLLAGQPTDDSELALTLGRSLVRRGTFDIEDVARAYARWYASDPFDVGNTIGHAFEAAAAASAHGDRSPADAARARALVESQANGALMRVSPLGIFGAVLPTADLMEMARADATLSHPHAACQDASALMAATIAHALRSGDGPRATYAWAKELAGRECPSPGVRRAIDQAGSAPPESYDLSAGWVLTALQNAFYRLLHAESFEDGVVDTVMCGGDTDTNGAIAGALLGAVHGRAAIPLRWRDRVMTCRPIAGAPGVNAPRPYEFWPVDALYLAERLACGPAKR